MESQNFARKGNVFKEKLSPLVCRGKWKTIAVATSALLLVCIITAYKTIYTFAQPKLRQSASVSSEAIKISPRWPEMSLPVLPSQPKALRLSAQSKSVLKSKVVAINVAKPIHSSNQIKCVQQQDVIARRKQLAHLPSCKNGHRPEQRLPDFIIIGEKKAGTSSLIIFASLNRAIRSINTEPHFFDKPEHYACGLNYYKSILPAACSDQVMGEKTPSYFRTPGAAAKIRSMNPDIKLILLLRDPVERTVSDYLTYVARLKVTSRSNPATLVDTKVVPFEQYVFHPNGSVKVNVDIVQRSIYINNLNRWHRLFKPEQFLYIDSNVLVQEPLHVVRKVERFLGVEKTAVPDETFYFNATRRFYCYKALNGKRSCLTKSKGRLHPDYSPVLLKRLADYFRPYNKELFASIKTTYDWGP